MILKRVLILSIYLLINGFIKSVFFSAISVDFESEKVICFWLLYPEQVISALYINASSGCCFRYSLYLKMVFALLDNCKS